MKKDVALTLSCGGARGLAHIGVIRELEARGYRIRSVAGCSIGSLIGAFLAMGKLDALELFMRSLSLDDMTDYIDFTLSEHGFIKAQRFINKLKELAPDCPIETLPVKLSIVATNLETGKAEIFTQGSIYRAVRASIAIPIVITSVEQHGAQLVDGSVVNPLPLDLARPQEGEISVAVNLYAQGTVELPAASPRAIRTATDMFAYLRKKLHAVRSWRTSLLQTVFNESNESTGYIGRIRSIFDLMTQRLIEKTLEAQPADIVIDIPLTAASVFDFYRAGWLIELGRRAASKALDHYETSSKGRFSFLYRWLRGGH